MSIKRNLQTAGNKIHPHAKRRAFIPCLGSNLEYNVGTQYSAANQNMYALQFHQDRMWWSLWLGIQRRCPA